MTLTQIFRSNDNIRCTFASSGKGLTLEILALESSYDYSLTRISSFDRSPLGCSLLYRYWATKKNILPAMCSKVKES